MTEFVNQEPVSVRLSAKKTSFDTGQPVEILISVTNRTADTLWIPTFERSKPYLGMFVLHFIAQERPLSRPILPTTALPAIDPKPLKPYETWTTEFDVSPWWSIPRGEPLPSVLHLKALWSLESLAKGDPNNKPFKGTATSNELRIEFNDAETKNIPWGNEAVGFQCRLLADKPAFWAKDKVVLFAEFRFLPDTRPLPHLLLHRTMDKNADGVLLKVWDDQGHALTYRGPVSKGEGIDFEDIDPIVNEIFQKKLDVTDWFAWSPGTYHVELTFSGSSYETHFPRYWMGTATSNKTTLKIQ